MSHDLYDIPLALIDGTPTCLAAYRGKVLLIVNVASKCGLTKQYQGLQALYAAKSGAGLEVLGFPANNFAGQEPGTEAEIASFCSTNYAVSFPMFQKISVCGEDRHRLYTGMVASHPQIEGAEAMRTMLSGYGMTPNPPPEVLWNFEKFVIGRDGSVIARFSPDTAPDDARLLAVIDHALAA